jgi:hypothetical protein
MNLNHSPTVRTFTHALANQKRIDDLNKTLQGLQSTQKDDRNVPSDDQLSHAVKYSFSESSSLRRRFRRTKSTITRNLRYQSTLTQNSCLTIKSIRRRTLFARNVSSES